MPDFPGFTGAEAIASSQRMPVLFQESVCLINLFAAVPYTVALASISRQLCRHLNPV